jgi:hypothetical protein
MDHFTFSEKTQRVYYIRVVGHVDETFICCTRFLFGGKVFGKISDRIPLDADICRSERYSVSVYRIYASVMIGKISSETFFLQDFCRYSLCKLIYYGTDDFQVSKLLCAYIVKCCLCRLHRHTVPLTQISE